MSATARAKTVWWPLNAEDAAMAAEELKRISATLDRVEEKFERRLDDQDKAMAEFSRSMDKRLTELEFDMKFANRIARIAGWIVGAVAGLIVAMFGSSAGAWVLKLWTDKRGAVGR